MKIRSSFVSNSSSSSFVVAFPKKPKNVCHVWNFMFDGKDGYVDNYGSNPLSYIQVANNVFNDIKRNGPKAKLNDIVRQFSGRYRYYTNDSTVWSGRVTDELGGAWSGKLDRYYCSDTALTDQYRKLIVDSDRRNAEFNEKEAAIIAKSGIQQPAKYAYKGGIDSDTNKPYTKKEVDTQEKYYRDLAEFKKTNPKYIKFAGERSRAWQEDNDAINKLQNKLAEKDAKNFIEDNKGKFIFIVSYSDNEGGDGCVMEHGNIFADVPHIRISNH